MITLPTDTYYRGYRLSETPDGWVNIWWGTDHIDSVKGYARAKRIIDEWVETGVK